MAALAAILLIATRAAGAAERLPPPTDLYRAFGADGVWTLDVAGGRATLTSRTCRRAASTSESWCGAKWAGRGRRRASRGCPDEVTLGTDAERTGCGGPRLPADSLFGFSWEIAQIAGGRVGGANYMVDFGPGSFLAYEGRHRAGCPYVQTDGRLGMKIEGMTMSGCGPVSGP